MKYGGLAPHIFNYLNEILVDLFIKRRIKFLDIVKLNEVNIRLPKNSSKDLMNDIVDLANKNKGDHLFVVHIPSEDGQERKIISKKIKVSNNNQFLILLRDLLGDSNVWID